MVLNDLRVKFSVFNGIRKEDNKAAFLYHKNTGQRFRSCFILFSYYIFVCCGQTQMRHVQSCITNVES